MTIEARLTGPWAEIDGTYEPLVGVDYAISRYHYLSGPKGVLGVDFTHVICAEPAVAQQIAADGRFTVLDSGPYRALWQGRFYEVYDETRLNVLKRLPHVAAALEAGLYVGHRPNLAGTRMLIVTDKAPPALIKAKARALIAVEFNGKIATKPEIEALIESYNRDGYLAMTEAVANFYGIEWLNLGGAAHARAYIALHSAEWETWILPDDLPNLVLWLSADSGTFQDAARTMPAGDGDPVGGWADRSATGNHASQATGDARPTLIAAALNNKPVLRFDGDDGLSLVQHIVSTEMTVFLVGKVTDNTVAQCFFSSAENSTNRWHIAQHSSRFVETRAYRNPYMAGENVRFNAAGYQILVSRVGTTADLYLDGLEGFVLDAGIVASGTPHTTIGHTKGTRYLTGDIAEILVYDCAMTETARRQVESYLADKYGLSVSYDTSPNALKYCTTPTYALANTCTHPDVLHHPEGWNGYDYWMVMTPYPGLQYENPSILASQDGLTWEVPPGLTNPVVPAPGEGYNSDPAIFMAPDETMWMIYRRALLPGSSFRVLSSTDGVNWSEETEVLVLDGGDVAPSIMYDGGQYVMWYRGVAAEILRRTATVPTGPWSEPETCPITGTPDGVDVLWHFDVVKHDTEYHMFTCEYIGSLHFATSPDGINWTYSKSILSATDTGWDNTKIYRSSGVWNGWGYDIWYSAHNVRDWWYVGKTALVLP